MAPTGRRRTPPRVPGIGWRTRSAWNDLVIRFNRLELSENTITFGFRRRERSAWVWFDRLIDRAYALVFG